MSTPRLHRMTVEEYERMVAAGFVPSRNRIQLINGYLVEKMTHNPPRAISFQRCGDALRGVAPAGWHVRPALPIRLPGQDSETDPDHCLLRGAIDDYLEHHPGPGDVALLVEFSDTTLAEDRDYVAHLYGPAGIPVCWIVDINGRRVEVYTGPGPGGYGPPAVFDEGQSLPVVIGGREVDRIAVADVLPPRRPPANAEGNGA